MSGQVVVYQFTHLVSHLYEWSFDTSIQSLIWFIQANALVPLGSMYGMFTYTDTIQIIQM